jgi:hypothetical protein
MNSRTEEQIENFNETWKNAEIRELSQSGMEISELFICRLPMTGSYLKRRLKDRRTRNKKNTEIWKINTTLRISVRHFFFAGRISVRH